MSRRRSTPTHELAPGEWFAQHVAGHASFGAEPQSFGDDSDSSWIKRSDDMAAIDRYFGSTQAITPEAVKIKDDFRKWYDALNSSWTYSLLPISQEDFDTARNYRNRFNDANAITASEKSAVENVYKTGLTKEQLTGGADRRLSSGMFTAAGGMSGWTVAALALAGVGLAGAGVAIVVAKPLVALYSAAAGLGGGAAVYGTGKIVNSTAGKLLGA